MTSVNSPSLCQTMRNMGITQAIRSNLKHFFLKKVKKNISLSFFSQRQLSISVYKQYKNIIIYNKASSFTVIYESIFSLTLQSLAFTNLNW